MKHTENGQRRPCQRQPGPFSPLAGIFLLAIGGLLLARELGADLPPWVFSWPMIVIGLALYLGLRLGFRRPSWIVLLAAGGLFLTDRIYPELRLRPMILPIVLMGMGLAFIFRRRGRRSREEGPTLPPSAGSIETESAGQPDARDFIDTTAFFGGTKKNVLSKNFMGGDIVNFMGGSEINLSKADFQGRVRIETTNIFGGTKLIVPPDWEIQSNVVTIFGGVDDRRPLQNLPNPSGKLLFIEGTCIFGGLEIRSFSSF